MSDQAHRTFLVEEILWEHPPRGHKCDVHHPPGSRCGIVAAGCVQRVLRCQHPAPSRRENRTEEGSGQPENKMLLRVLTEDKHAGSFPTNSGGLICILPEKRKDASLQQKKHKARGYDGAG